MQGADPTEPTISWHNTSSFKTGEPVPFRLPYFQGYKAYPDLDPLYNVLLLPKDYDPQRSNHVKSPHLAPDPRVMRLKFIAGLGDEAVDQRERPA